jgi:NADPH-dependent glutamate synthase beta subunit-like oxidoreductase/ferredoxin
MYKTVIPDQEYWKKNIPCLSACPVSTDARGYNRAIVRGDFEGAYRIARAPNPLASLCGHICGAPCEIDCRRGTLDLSVAIRALKLASFEHSEAFTTKPAEIAEDTARSIDRRECVSGDDIGVLTQGIAGGDLPKIDNRSVGIIGSGPAGLAAAHDLTLTGCSCVIYEREPVAAGMLILGVPPYRLPRSSIEAEVEAILSLGVEIKTGCTVGDDISLSRLRKEHDAVIVACGLRNSRSLPLPGADAEGVVGGVEYLRGTALEEPPAIGSKIVVIGGGNVAYDVARTALRRHQMDIARTALKGGEGARVTLCCIERREEMLADEIEILEGNKEGVLLQTGYGPQKILVEQGKVKGVVFQKVLSIFDEQNRFSPTYDPGDTITLDADTVLWAIGQKGDFSFLKDKTEQVAVTKRGLVEHNVDTTETNADMVFAAGDVAKGPGLMIDAIASGKKTARAIYERLTGKHLRIRSTEHHRTIYSYEREIGYEKVERQAMVSSEVEARMKSLEALVEKSLSPDEAQLEGSRCFNCGINTIFDGSKCILCGGCVDICPRLCLKLVPASELSGEDTLSELIETVKEKKNTEELTAIIKDEERCIRCGLCYHRCPAGAITMEQFTFREKLEAV